MRIDEQDLGRQGGSLGEQGARGSVGVAEGGFVGCVRGWRCGVGGEEDAPCRFLRVCEEGCGVENGEGERGGLGTCCCEMAGG